MAKVKLTLNPSPTFKSVVQIPVPGGAAAPVEFVFKARTKDGFKQFIESIADREDAEIILDVASGWDLDEPFDRENVEKLVQGYIGAGRAILAHYVSELTAARAKN